MRYHNAGLPYRLSIISLSFPHSCATGGFRLANDTCMCRYTLPRRRHWLFGGAGHRGTQKQGPSTGGEGEGGAGEDVRGCGGDVGRVFGYLYREKRGIKGGKGWEEKGTGGGECVQDGRGFYGELAVGLIYQGHNIHFSNTATICDSALHLSILRHPRSYPSLSQFLLSLLLVVPSYLYPPIISCLTPTHTLPFLFCTSRFTSSSPPPYPTKSPPQLRIPPSPFLFPPPRPLHIPPPLENTHS